MYQNLLSYIQIQINYYMVYRLTLKFYTRLFPENIALNKLASHVGTHKWYGPHLANDGNLAQGPHGVCSWTDSRESDADPAEKGQPAWWSVDMASDDPSQRFVVTSVTLYFCIPACHCMYLI